MPTETLADCLGHLSGSRGSAALSSTTAPARSPDGLNAAADAGREEVEEVWVQRADDDQLTKLGGTSGRRFSSLAGLDGVDSCRQEF